MRRAQVLLCQLVIVSSLLVLYSAGWSDEPRRGGEQHISSDPRLDITEALAIAFKRATAELGKEAKEYFAFKAEFNPETNQWLIQFAGPETRLRYDDCFNIFVDGTTKATRFRGCP